MTRVHATHHLRKGSIRLVERRDWRVEIFAPLAGKWVKVSPSKLEARARRNFAALLKNLRGEDNTVTSRRKVKYPGIMADARALKVHRIHLWLVLTGRRESTPLLARYRALKQNTK